MVKSINKKEDKIKLIDIKKIRFAPEFEFELPAKTESDRLIERGKTLKGWEIKNDGSLNNGIELSPENSNHLYYNEDSFLQIKEILALVRVYRGKAKPTCGLHIHCFKWGTKIMLPDYTSKSIERIKIGDNILGLNLISGEFISTKISKKYCRNADTIDLYYNNKFLVSVTPEHPIIKYLAQTPVNNRRINYFYPAEHIKQTKYITFNNNRQDENYRDKSWHRGWLDGYISGDGHIINAKHNKNSKITFHCKDKNLLNFINICFNKVGLKRNMSIHQDNKNYFYSCVGGKDVYNFLRNSHLRNSTFYKLGYLAGFFDAEGTQTSNEIILCNTNLKKINKIKQYCNELNISFKLRIRKTQISNRKFYELRIMPAIDFYAQTHPNKLKYKPLKYWGCKDISRITYKKGKKVRVYNFETGTNTYIANGLIVHNCNIKNLTDKQIITIIKEWIHKQKYIAKRFNISKERIANTCKLLPKSELHKLTEKELHNFRNNLRTNFRHYSYIDEKYYSLNISHLPKEDYQTIEFRLFSSTTNFREIKEVIYFVLNFIKESLERE